MRIVHTGNEEAARLGSWGGEGTDQHEYDNTTASAAQPRCTPMPVHGAARKERVEQLRLIPLDGAWAEPYTPFARARNNVATSAAAGEVRRAKQWV